MTWHSWSLHHWAEISYCKYLRKFRTLARKSGDTSSWQDYAIYIMYKKEHKPFGGLLKKYIFCCCIYPMTVKVTVTATATAYVYAIDTNNTFLLFSNSLSVLQCFLWGIKGRVMPPPPSDIKYFHLENW